MSTRRSARYNPWEALEALGDDEAEPGPESGTAPGGSPPEALREGTPVTERPSRIVVCQCGSRFSRCPSPSVDSCQYCGRNFCEGHTYYLEGHEAVCTRKRCKTKHDDLQLHMAYRERVRQRNSVGLCGEEECGPHPRQECSLCLGLFCENHVRERYYPFREGSVVIERPASVCGWCWQRRKVWRR